MILKQQLSRRIRSRLAIVMMLVLLLGMISSSPVAAQGTGPAPTVGEIVVDDYNCETGVIEFHVPVTNLPAASGPSREGQTLVYWYVTSYEGTNATASPSQDPGYSPAASQAPYTGDVRLSLTVPTTNFGNSAVTSIDLGVRVGYDYFSTPTDSTEHTYVVDCDDDDPSTGDIIQQLIAVLIALLRTLLNR